MGPVCLHAVLPTSISITPSIYGFMYGVESERNARSPCCVTRTISWLGSRAKRMPNDSGRNSLTPFPVNSEMVRRLISVKKIGEDHTVCDDELTAARRTERIGSLLCLPELVATNVVANSYGIDGIRLNSNFNLIVTERQPRARILKIMLHQICLHCF